MVMKHTIVVACLAFSAEAYSMVDCWNKCLDDEGLTGDDQKVLLGKSFCDGADDAMECAFDCTPKEIKKDAAESIMKPWRETEDAMCNDDDAPCRDHMLCDKIKDEDYKGDDKGEEKSLGKCMEGCLDDKMPGENEAMSQDEFCGGLEDAIGCQFDCVPEEVDAGDAILAPFQKLGTQVCTNNGVCQDKSLCDKLAKGDKGWVDSRLYDAKIEALGRKVGRKVPAPASKSILVVSGSKAEESIKQWTAAFTRGPMPSAGFLATCAVMGFFVLGGAVFAWRRSVKPSTDAHLMEAVAAEEDLE